MHFDIKRRSHPLELTGANLLLGEIAIAASRARGSKYNGKSSPHWYGTDSFHELMMSTKPDDTSLREFLSSFDGCSAKAGEITSDFVGRPVKGLSRVEAARVLERAKSVSREVRPARLGALGEGTFPGAYAKEEGYINMPRNTDKMLTRLPAVVEVRADANRAGSQAVFLVNGTPCITRADAVFYPKLKMTTVYGHGFKFMVKTGKTGMCRHINISMPFMQMTSEGKDPALEILVDLLKPAIEKAAKRAKKLVPKDDYKPNIKTTVFDHMDEQIAIVSDNRRYRFNWRQVFYRIRPIVNDLFGGDLSWDYFNQDLVVQYEEEFEEEPNAYRDPRGTFYHPHTGESYPLGTLFVEEYCRPKWTFNKISIYREGGLFRSFKSGRVSRKIRLCLADDERPTNSSRERLD